MEYEIVYKRDKHFENDHSCRLTFQCVPWKECQICRVFFFLASNSCHCCCYTTASVNICMHAPCIGHFKHAYCHWSHQRQGNSAKTQVRQTECQIFASLSQLQHVELNSGICARIANDDSIWNSYRLLYLEWNCVATRWLWFVLRSTAPTRAWSRPLSSDWFVCFVFYRLVQTSGWCDVLHHRATVTGGKINWITNCMRRERLNSSNTGTIIISHSLYRKPLNRNDDV